MPASVKIMLSYDYCHFEVCKSTDEELTNEQIDALRKDVQRLADKAVKQYKLKQQAANIRQRIEMKKYRFVNKCKELLNMPQELLSPEEQKMIESYKSGEYIEKFKNPEYDYQDDFNIPPEDDDEFPF